MVDRNSKAATKTCIGAHQDNENGWVEGTGLGVRAPFNICEIATKNRETIIHKSGEVIEFPYPMNWLYTHQVPPYCTF
jgi:hypothetical protein